MAIAIAHQIAAYFATGEIKEVLREREWLGHLQFSPTDPHQIMFCHEGTWHEVDRVWLIRTDGTGLTKVHTRTMNMEIAQFFFEIGIPVFDCYGLTETSPASTMNCSSAYRLGSVGKVLKRVEIVIDKSVVESGATDGEIIIYGPNVMQGYHNKPEDTKAVMTDDGGFRTGDRGRFDEDGYLYITGRIKEQYKLENGKYVFPTSLEEDIKLIPGVLNAMIYGEGKPYNICLVYPDYNILKKYAEGKGLPTDIARMAANPEIKKYMEDEIARNLKGKYGGYEIPKKIVLLSEDFSLENGMLTQTMKLRRKVVIEKFRDDIAKQF